MTIPIAEEEDVRSLCKDCKNRFRRVFIPSNMQKFLDMDDDAISTEGEDVVIMTMCLASDMDLDLDATIECTHYIPIEGTPNLLMHR